MKDMFGMLLVAIGMSIFQRGTNMLSIKQRGKLYTEISKTIKPIVQAAERLK